MKNEVTPEGGEQHSWAQFLPRSRHDKRPIPQRTRDAVEETLPISGVTRDFAQAWNEAGIKNREVLRNTTLF
jgi:hypothetical protein